MRTLDAGAVQDLRQGLRGQVILPGDAAYDAARSVWNGMIDRHPALVVRCAGVADVIAAIRFARSQALPVAVRGGGHNVAGFGTCDDGIVIDLGPMKGVRVDPAARTARAQAGLTWGEFDHETQAFGLATTGGLVSETGVAGFTVGGGIGWLMRKHGMTIDNLLSADVVTADGEQVIASRAKNSDLFWGLRGGGGNFGIVTSFQYQLHPVGPLVFGGALFHTADRAADFLRFYGEWTATLPDEITPLFAFLTAPPAPFVPAPLVGQPLVAVALCCAAPPERGADLVAPLRAFGPPAIDLLGPIPYLALQKMFDESAPRGIRTYWKTAYFDRLDGPTVDTLVEHAQKMASLSPLSAIHVHYAEGAMGRVPPSETAFGARHARYIANLIGMWPDPTRDGAHVDWVRGLWNALQPVASDGAYVNFLGDEGVDRVRSAYGTETYVQLARLKARYDPANVFRINQNIKPQQG